MCTLTFNPQPEGYFVFMNRDEQRSRIAALPPTPRRLGQRSALHPSEPGGGTWIALDDTGVVLALLNWYSAPRREKPDPISRGTVIPTLLGEHAPEAVGDRLTRMPLDRMQPFRLVGIFPSHATGRIREWRWDGASLDEVDHPWILSHWISSGADEPGAERERRACFHRHRDDPLHGSLAWLSRLHASHEPHAGPLSICVHRPDAATVSQTRIVWSDGGGSMQYIPGQPCSTALLPSVNLPAATSPESGGQATGNACPAFSQES